MSADAQQRGKIKIADDAVNFRLDSIVVKNLSLEIPENVVAPVFTKKPEVQLELRNKSRPLNRDHYYEVQLEAAVHIKSSGELQVLIEVQQAGIFYFEEKAGQRQQEFLGIHAPTMLYPYLTYLVGDLMSHAGAPRVFLPPFNFALAYEKKQELMQKKLQEGESGGKALS